MRKVLILIIGCLTLAHAASYAMADESVLSIALLPERPQYVHGEDVQITIVLKNTSNAGVLIPISWELGHMYVGLDRDGHTAVLDPFGAPVTRPYEEVLKLAPTQTYSRAFSVGERYVDTSGKYKIIARFKSDGTYLAGNAITKECWKGEVVSDWVAFEIIEPTSDEDKAAYAILTDNGKIDVWTALSPYEYEKAPSETWWRVIKEHPTSAYARAACEAEAQRIVNRPMPPDKEEWDEMRRLRDFAEKHWPKDILVDVIDAQIVACLYGDEKDKEAEELTAKIKERAPSARVLGMLDGAKRTREIVIAEEKRIREEAARNAQPPSPPPGPGPNPPPPTNAGGTSGTPNATGTGTSSEGGAEGAVAEAAPFPWAIVIVVAIAALSLGAITTLLLTRRKRA